MVAKENLLIVYQNSQKKLLPICKLFSVKNRFESEKSNFNQNFHCWFFLNKFRILYRLVPCLECVRCLWTVDSKIKIFEDQIIHKYLALFLSWFLGTSGNQHGLIFSLVSLSHLCHTLLPKNPNRICNFYSLL